MHIVQITDQKGKRRVGVVEGNDIALLKKVSRTIDLAALAIKGGNKLGVAAKSLSGGGTESYAKALKDRRVHVPVDHPDPAHCLVTGTGLTHLGSASARDKMHQKLAGEAEQLTDSLKMFKMGLEGGKPEKGKAGVQPEWFYKGDGSWLVAPGQPLERPAFALDGGEEPEMAAIYLIGPTGKPHRLGFALGNEYSDHIMERQNYLYLAHSKLRQCSFGPELVAGKIPDHIEGMSRIRRNGQIIWEKPFLTGEGNMSHTLANLEFHHFKYDHFRRPGDLHVHFFGTGTLSIADGVETKDGDEFEVEAAPFGMALRNRLKAVKERYKPGAVKAL
ncbi:AraD1 family protein [Aestuariivirga sp.]|uniref:AraD1 family protein n=1 Tax=Aestuariivirga sp. TaxID=2650926 RepID=UPI0039E3F366